MLDKSGQQDLCRDIQPLKLVVVDAMIIRELCVNRQQFSISWFDVVNDVKIKYGVCEDDTYNVDETGFMMGLTGSEIVITGTDIRGRKKVVLLEQRVRDGY